MKLIFTLLICFIVFNTVQAQNATLDAANRSVYNSISPIAKITKTNSIIITNNTTIIAPTSKPIDVFDLFYNQEIFTRLTAPNTGLQNNPNMELFRKSLINNLNYNVTIPNKFIYK